MNNNSQIKCAIPFQNMVIDANGNVSVCPYIINDPDRPQSMGNVNNASILDIWNSKEYQDLRAYMYSEEGDMGCKNCLNMKQNAGSVPAVPVTSGVESYEQLEAWKNYQQFLEDIQERHLVMKAKPMVVSYTSSHSCNFRCIMCYQQHVRKEKLKHIKKTDIEMLELIPYLAQLTAGGGEPFIQPMWKQMIFKYSGEYPLLTFAVTTNGSFVNKAAIDALSFFPRVLMNFSYDGTTKEIFEHIRVNSNFEKVHTNLLANIDHMHEVGAEKYCTTASMTVMKENFENVISMLRLMLEKRVQINFSGLVIYPLCNSLISYYDLPAQLSQMRVTANAITDFLQNQVFEQSFASPAKAQIQSFLDIMPYYLLEVPHYTLQSEIPPLYFVNCKSSYPGQHLQIAFAQDDNGEIGKPYWYASIGENGEFTAVLPEGKYAVYVGPSNIGVTPSHSYLTVFVRHNDTAGGEIEVRQNVKNPPSPPPETLLTRFVNRMKKRNGY